MQYHEAANIFPLDEEHLDELAQDISDHGQQIAIETLDGLIVDGRRRYLACQRAGIEPKFRKVEVVDPFAYVISLNIHRRHLTPSQLSMSAAMAREGYEKMAKERQKASTSMAGKASGASRRGESNVVENLPPRSDNGKARDQVGGTAA